jgi:hypothetical protein
VTTAHVLRRRYGRARASIGKGWRHIEPRHRYAIVGLVPMDVGARRGDVVSVVTEAELTERKASGG